MTVREKKNWLKIVFFHVMDDLHTFNRRQFEEKKIPQENFEGGNPYKRRLPVYVSFSFLSSQLSTKLVEFQNHIIPAITCGIGNLNNPSPSV